MPSSRRSSRPRDCTHVCRVSYIGSWVLYQERHLGSPHTHRKALSSLTWDAWSPVKVKVAQSCPTLCNPMDCSLPGSSVHGDSLGKNMGVGCHALFQGIFPTQGSNPGPPSLQVESLPSEPPGKPKNTGMGSVSLLQRIFPTQQSNWGLLRYRQIPYQLSYQGSPPVTLGSKP